MERKRHFILAVLLVILTKVTSEESRKLSWMKPDFDESGFDLKKETFFNYISRWNSSITEKQEEIDHIDKYNGNHIADTIFESSVNNTSFIFTDMSKCLIDYQFFTCMKMLLLSRVKNLLVVMESTNTTGTDYSILHGLVKFKWLNTTEYYLEDIPESKGSSDQSLDKELTNGLLKLFHSRSLQVALLPGYGVEITPKPKADEDGIVCFTAKAISNPAFTQTALTEEMRHKTGGGKKKKKKKHHGFSMMPMMIIPQMIMLGMMPFALANLKVMVMNAFMMNTMALNGMIFMTIRNLVFGPRGGSKVKYVNYGYDNEKKSKKPTIVLHSPAAFVKKPEDEQTSYESSPGPNYYDNSGPGNYNANLGGYQRRNNLNKHRIRVDEHNNIIQFAPPEVNRIVSQMLDNSQNNKFRPNQYRFETTTSAYISPNYLTNFEATSVDAPASYLNNNQFVLPSTKHPNGFQNRQDPNRFYPNNENPPNYKAFNNMNLITQNVNQNVGASSNEKYSSKYNVSPNSFESSNEYYASLRHS